ncbi:hypothetical protein C8Q70DRAFT_518794 [Cubamyces menziesii]|nr:hypothetical protein C8Q70DRAFT_518794 [Cubamyces menziesii]
MCTSRSDDCMTSPFVHQLCSEAEFAVSSLARTSILLRMLALSSWRFRWAILAYLLPQHSSRWELRTYHNIYSRGFDCPRLPPWLPVTPMVCMVPGIQSPLIAGRVLGHSPERAFERALRRFYSGHWPWTRSPGAHLSRVAAQSQPLSEKPIPTPGATHNGMRSRPCRRIPRSYLLRRHLSYLLSRAVVNHRRSGCLVVPTRAGPSLRLQIPFVWNSADSTRISSSVLLR